MVDSLKVVAGRGGPGNLIKTSRELEDPKPTRGSAWSGYCSTYPAEDETLDHLDGLADTGRRLPENGLDKDL